MYTVYKHVSPNGKTYIGITRQPVEKRWLKGEGYIKCPVFYKAIKKYGWENFRHFILIEGLTRERAEEAEIKLIREYRSTERAYGYNLANGGNHKGKCSEETRKKISLSNMGRRQSKETIQKRIARGEKHYLFGKHLSDETKAKMSTTKTGVRRDSAVCEKISASCTNLKKSKAHAAKVARAHWVGVEQYTLDGVLLRRYQAIKHAAEKLGKSHSKIVVCCQGKRKTAYGYVWKYTAPVDEA